MWSSRTEPMRSSASHRRSCEAQTVSVRRKKQGAREGGVPRLSHRLTVEGQGVARGPSRCSSTFSPTARAALEISEEAHFSLALRKAAHEKRPIARDYAIKCRSDCVKRT